jgi:hypothetical protein
MLVLRRDANPFPWIRRATGGVASLAVFAALTGCGASHGDGTASQAESDQQALTQDVFPVSSSVSVRVGTPLRTSDATSRASCDEASGTALEEAAKLKVLDEANMVCNGRAVQVSEWKVGWSCDSHFVPDVIGGAGATFRCN